MFTSFSNIDDALITNRLGRVQSAIASLKLSTMEDYVAQLTSLVNQVINADYQMLEPIVISAQTPAYVGDIVSNLLNLNNDCGDIAAEIERLENNASVLYNLSAATQNSVRQTIREGIYASTGSLFTEAFINQQQISSSTGTIDFVCGRAMSLLIKETELNPTISIGLSSIGSTTDSISTLLEGDATNLFTWNGSTLEIIIQFPITTVVNRLVLATDDYKGYTISTLTTSPDGSLFTDVLLDLGVTSIDTGAAAGKYSGSSIIDFSPRSVSTMRLIIENNVDATTIPLRSLSLTQRTYQASGTITSTPQNNPTGTVLFEVDNSVFAPYVSVTYQVSSDGVVFTTIQPGTVTLPDTWWYRILFNRSSQAFTQGSIPLTPTTADPAFSSGFTLVNSTSTIISTNTIERVLVFEDVTGVIPLREVPIPGTLNITQGSVYLTSSQYTFSNNSISFPGSMDSVTVSYQTSAQGTTNIAALQTYYSAYVDMVQFT